MYFYSIIVPSKNGPIWHSQNGMSDTEVTHYYQNEKPNKSTHLTNEVRSGRTRNIISKRLSNKLNFHFALEIV